ncbi:MAG: hypothetical protein JWP59_3232 [Massilia sp.]|jgi:hypothetical protein|nr:hypothetical protein [Massilia sp.]
MKRSKRTRTRPGLGGIGLLFALAAGSVAADDGLAKAADVQATPVWLIDVYYENHLATRGKDDTGKNVGLSKFRNTLQVEADRKFGDGWRFHSVLRGTYDGVYRLNKDQFGSTAGGPAMLQLTAGGQLVPVPNGQGPVGKTLVNSLGLVNNAFVDSYPTNPNDGLRVLGDRWHGIDGGVAFGVPVRPCNVDARGCFDLGGYGDLSESKLASPEFNKRLDFLREAYVTNTIELASGKQLFLKLGRQQVVWGRTDLFRVLDVINPVDYSRNNIYDELQDIRIPMWIAQAEYRMGASESMQDRNLQVVWNVDKFRPNNLGQCGSPNAILDAGCFFRGMKNLWDNGGTVANFANVAPGTLLATNFGPHQIGIANVDLPAWKLGNTQLGLKFEGITKDGLNFSLNALTYRSQLPSLHGGKRAVNAFTGEYSDAWPYLISFDVAFPRVHLLGGSLDFQWATADAAVRMEGAFTRGEEFANTLRPELFSSNKVFRGVIGIDRPTFIPFISTSRTVLFSGQLFWQHIFDHETASGPLGQTGMVDWKDNLTGTLLMKAFFAGDRVSPQVIMARDFRARAYVVSPSVEWSVSDQLKLTVGANVKGGGNSADYAVDDCRSCNPWPPFTAPFGDPQAMQTGSRGLSGFEPLGRFRAGPIGTAVKENDLFATLRYKF